MKPEHWLILAGILGLVLLGGRSCSTKECETQLNRCRIGRDETVICQPTSCGEWF